MAWCPCMARAPEWGSEAPRTRLGSGVAHPLKGHTHTALAMQSGMLAARMTLYVSTGLVGHGQGTCSLMDVAVLELQRWMAAR